MKLFALMKEHRDDLSRIIGGVLSDRCYLKLICPADLGERQDADRGQGETSDSLQDL